MDYIKQHINNSDTVKIACSDKFQEYVTCTKPVRSDTHWTCVEGGYDTLYDIPDTYDYKIIKTLRLPYIIKKVVFETTNKDHKLVNIQSLH